MKSSILLSLLIALCSGHVSKAEISNGNVDSLVIRTVLLNGAVISTPFRVECSGFEQAFGTKVNTFTLRHSEQTRRILDAISTAKMLHRVQSVDTRAKVIIYYQGSVVDSLCMDDNGGFLHAGRVLQFMDHGKYLIQLTDSLHQLHRR